MLLSLLNDYHQNADLRARFAATPTAVLDEYEIPAEVRESLLSGDRRRIAEALVAESEKLQSVSPGWNPPLEILSFAPPEASTGEKIKLTLHGVSFSKGAGLTFSNPGANVQAEGVKVSADGTILTGSATFKKSGKYTVTVNNPQGGSATAQKDFTAI